LNIQKKKLNKKIFKIQIKQKKNIKSNNTNTFGKKWWDISTQVWGGNIKKLGSFMRVIFFWNFLGKFSKFFFRIIYLRKEKLVWEIIIYLY